MPLKLSLGLTEKRGLPDYGSLAAGCHVELEVEASLLHGDPDGFHRRVRDAYAACRQAVHEELAKHPSIKTAAGGQNGHGSIPPQEASRSNAAARENGRPKGASTPRASQKQFEYLQQLAKQIPGLGVRQLEKLAQNLCGRPMAELSSFDASSLIDTLKAIKAGQIDLDAVVAGGRA